MVETNLQILRPSRPKLRPGDIFTMRVPDGRYLFGRVILSDLPREAAPLPGSNLIYVYDVMASEKLPPPIESLTPDRLLIPPQFTNRLAWSKGYFENVDHRPLQESDLLPRHGFWDAVRKRYCDEAGNPLSSRTEPCGDWGLVSYRYIDDLVSDAVHIPRVP